MKTRREGRTVERMLSRRCYRSRYLLACEPSACSRLMARSVMNVAARGATAITAPSWYHKSRLPRVLRPYAARYLTHTLVRARMCVRYYQYGRGMRAPRARRRRASPLAKITGLPGISPQKYFTANYKAGLGQRLGEFFNMSALLAGIAIT